MSKDLIKQFVKSTKDSDGISKETIAYGTVKKENSGDITVLLDGAENPMPVSKAMDAEDGDRVTVSIKNHSAVITGNLTSPASARTATHYMKLTTDGLLIGRFNDGKPEGYSCLITGDAYKILDTDGDIVGIFSGTQISLLGGEAVFAPNLLKFGKSGATIEMLNGAAHIKADTNADASSKTLIIEGGEDITGVALRNKNGGSVSEIIAGEGEASMQVFQNGELLSSLFLNSGGGYLTGQEILTSNTNLIVAGAVRIKGRLDAGKHRLFAGTIPAKDIPEGYTLTGIRQISTNYPAVCKLTGFYTNPVNNKVIASLMNTGNNDLKNTGTNDGRVEVRIEWFAVRSSITEPDQEDAYIELRDDE